ncbi:MAG: DDE-type integrase/transposase/recombinase [Fusobacteria bacterium]|nr:DDE-type integrase/transposase/recombinase [Fusobacteriota bacterium]
MSGHNIDRRKSSNMTKELKTKTVYPKPNLSLGKKTYKKFPYLLTGLEITRKNQVWCTDITYIRTQNGFMYLTAIIDVYSRYIVA